MNDFSIRDPRLTRALTTLEFQIMKYVPEQALPGVIAFINWMAFSIQGLRPKHVVKYTTEQTDDEDTGNYPH